ncbi:hypothetical protein [Streptomyces sp. NPDC006285]|uniref:hypothetical protein n=1 Tax=Streptomyces sp. NPDC006285 TaxID=3364742 RepID=UPI00368D531E
MDNSDNLLELLIKRVNSGTGRLEITLTVGGALITGKLIPRKAWLEANISLLDKSAEAKAFVADFAGEGGSFDSEDYVHLTGAKTLFGLEPPVSHGAGLVRIATSDVDAWSLGRISIDQRGQ